MYQLIVLNRIYTNVYDPSNVCIKVCNGGNDILRFHYELYCIQFIERVKKKKNKKCAHTELELRKSIKYA